MSAKTRKSIQFAKFSKQEIENIRNPIIHTLDEAFALADQPAATADERRANTSRAAAALEERATSRLRPLEHVRRLNHAERLTWFILYAQGDILNGGFHQYLTNNTADAGEDVKKYLKEIGAKDTLKLFNEVSKIFPKGKIPTDRDKRETIIDKLTEKIMAGGDDMFDAWDNRFYTQKEDLCALIVAYAREHRDQFLEPSDDIVRKCKRRDQIKAYYLRLSKA